MGSRSAFEPPPTEAVQHDALTRLSKAETWRTTMRYIDSEWDDLETAELDTVEELKRFVEGE